MNRRLGRRIRGERVSAEEISRLPSWTEKRDPRHAFEQVFIDERGYIDGWLSLDPWHKVREINMAFFHVCVINGHEALSGVGNLGPMAL